MKDRQPVVGDSVSVLKKCILGNKRTLYVTDLDGTLLDNGARISDKTAAMLNRLIADGAAVTVASARGVTGVGLVAGGEVDFRLPLILMNGAIFYNLDKKLVGDACVWDTETTMKVLRICENAGRTPFLYRVHEGQMLVEFVRLSSEGELRFFNERNVRHSGFYKQVEQYHISDGGCVYISMQDSAEVLAPIREKLMLLDDVDTVMYHDIYNEGNWFLEASSARSGKGNAVSRLREQTQAERVVVFGDNLNDMSMFEVADVRCAVENAHPDLIAAADCVIGSNDNDGVAEFIMKDYFGREE